MATDKNSKYLLDLYKNLYEEEVKSSTQQMGRYSFHVTVATALSGAVGYVIHAHFEAPPLTVAGGVLWYFGLVFTMCASLKDTYLFPEPRFVCRPFLFPAFRPALAGFGTADRGSGHAAGCGHGGRPFRRCNSEALDQGQGANKGRPLISTAQICASTMSVSCFPPSAGGFRDRRPRSRACCRLWPWWASIPPVQFRGVGPGPGLRTRARRVCRGR